MTILEQILHQDETAVESSGPTRLGLPWIEREVRFGIGIGGSAEPLFESGVAYVEEPNPLLILARRYEVPERYGEYRGRGPRLIEPEDESFPVDIPPEADEDFR